MRRLRPDFNYDLALLNKTTGTPWSPRRNTYDPKFTTPSQSPRPPQRDAVQQTNAEDNHRRANKRELLQDQYHLRRDPTTGSSSSQLPGSPMATSPTTLRHPPTSTANLRRLNQDEVMQPTKAQKTKAGTTVRTTEQDTTEPQSQRQRINVIAAIELHNGTTIQSHTNDDPDEQQQPIIFDNEGGMKTEATQMKLHEVYEEVDISTLDPSTIREGDCFPTRWVHREKGQQVRSRIVAKGYSEKVDDEDSVCASTPMFTMLRILLLLQLARPGWTARLGDVSTAFLHAPLLQRNEQPTYIGPPKELCPRQNKLWRGKASTDYAVHQRHGKTT